MRKNALRGNFFTDFGNTAYMKRITTDGNGAASYVSYAFSELAVIYPITPSSPMAELADEWSASEKPNLFGQVPKVVQMQSEAGAAGALHGALSCGALTTTYTCSQGLLLMLPNMYKIAGELLPAVFHVSARALATHALSIFGDHQDVMACRQSGFAFLASSSVQETMDLAVVAHLSALSCSLPFVHFFDGFRTSHETAKIESISYEEMKSLVNDEDIARFKARKLDPARPVQRGTAQNPDIYFQNREAANPYYLAAPKKVQEAMDKLAKLTGRAYHLFDYFGAKDAERVLVMMGSGGSTAEETAEKLNCEGEKTGVIKVRLYRPFAAVDFCRAIPKTCKKIAVLDRTKEAGSLGEPLYLDVCAALKEGGLSHIQAVGGRYGLGSKEFTPAMVYAVFENLKRESPKNHFTVGIEDDITHTSLDCSAPCHSAPEDCVSCTFYGLGSDGTVGANKNSIKILGNHTDLFVQGYFCYDSKKSGGATVSHLRFGKSPIRSAYLIEQADFVACHNPSYLTRYDMLGNLKEGGRVLLNCPWTSLDALNAHLPPAFKRALANKHAQLFVIDGTKIANETGLGGRTGTVMQAAFFLLHTHILPYETALSYLKEELKKKFLKKGERVVEQNFTAVDRVQNELIEISYPDEWATTNEGAPPLARPKTDYFENFIEPILKLKGDTLPVSAFQADGTVPTGTTRLEKHGVPYLLPKWIPENCIQCNQCSFVCPHATIRPFLLEENQKTPTEFTTLPAVGIKGAKYRIQVSPHDCMGCGVCAKTCPAKQKALVMRPAEELMPAEGGNWEFAAAVRQAENSVFKPTSVKGSQFKRPLFEFSYACAGCGETPYIKVLTQLFGDRMVIANATGCSSIYGGSAPTCPYTVNEDGRGPAWANSLFEDNAEFGLGMRLAYDTQGGKDKSVWIIGGDGWAYDIGYGGLDHALATGKNINILVLDSQVYSNTGGQVSKATPMGARARFASTGKALPRKDLGLMAMTYGYVYVAQVSMGANHQQLLNALNEAENYQGPSLIIAYSPCIAHGVDMGRCMEEEKLAVDSGFWQLYRFHPDKGLTLDCKPPTLDLRAFLSQENRFKGMDGERLIQAEKECKKRRELYEYLAQFPKD